MSNINKRKSNGSDKTNPIKRSKLNESQDLRIKPGSNTNKKPNTKPTQTKSNPNPKPKPGTDSDSDLDSGSGSDSDSESDSESSDSSEVPTEPSSNTDVSNVFFDSDDSSDSENEYDEFKPELFALNLLKKKHRHNKKSGHSVVAKLFHESVVMLDIKYKKTKNQTAKTRFKKILDACKELDNELRNQIDQLKRSFKINEFIKKQQDKIKSDDSDGSGSESGSESGSNSNLNQMNPDLNNWLSGYKNQPDSKLDDIVFTILFTDQNNMIGSNNFNSIDFSKLFENMENYNEEDDPDYEEDGEDGEDGAEGEEGTEGEGKETDKQDQTNQTNKKTPQAKPTNIDKEFEELYDQDNITTQNGLKYFKTLSTEKKRLYLEKLKQVKQALKDEEKRPNYMKILDCETTESNKAIILQKINTFENIRGSSEFYKLKNWINKIMKVPFGKYVKPPVVKSDGPIKIREYLKGVRKHLDDGIYGHETTKDQLIKILAHTITNPQEGGNVFALQGPPGVGKTALIQDGVAKALGRPYSFISLGGATDSCFLEGHDYTYEGSNHGRIVEVLQQAGVMNPVIYFDELDKVSETAKGEEIINILMHITDSTQNSHFNDKYFGGIDFDLSKAIIIFSFNEEQKVSRILRDRMKIIRVKGYKMLDKLNISKDYLIPKMLKQIGLDDIQIEFSDEILTWMIDTYTNEGGVRRLKELFNDILLEINLRKLEDSKINGTEIKDKIVITKQLLEDDLIKKKRKIEHLKINSEPKVGVVNGLWANDLGVGGLIPIECCWIPATDKLQLELTGMQGQVMKESMSVARTIAWRILPDEIKDSINEKWKNTFDYGIHIHCPDGATPKDGPSAGGAITTCLISLLTGIPVDNTVAMTGEINLKGHITAIGGLEEKIFGAKKAGARRVLCPKENSTDLKEITNKFPALFSDDFEVKTVETIWEILDIVMEKNNWIRFD